MVEIITQNVKCFPQMRQFMVEHDVELTMMQADIICWQEIQEQRYVDAIQNASDYWSHFIDLSLGGCPISWHNGLYELVDGGSKTMYPAVPFISRDRKVVWVKLRNLRTNEIVVVVNAHFVAGAFSARTSLLRKRLWRRCRNTLIKVVAKFVQQGHPVIVCGDINRHGFRVLGNFFELEDGTRRSVQYPVDLDEIDQIMLINGEQVYFSEKKTKYTKERGRYSDHQGNKVTTGMRKRIKP